MTFPTLIANTSDSCSKEVREAVPHEVRQFGNSVSIALLDPGCQIFKESGIDGILGYYKVGNCAVVIGDPPCPPSDTPAMIKAFQKTAKSIVYATVSEQFTQWAMGRVAVALLKIGDELTVNPENDPTVGPKARKLRNKLSVANRAGVTIKEYLVEDPVMEQKMEEVASSWIHSRKGPQVFLANVDIFDQRPGKRWFYAEMKGEIIGVLMLNQLQARQGWLFNLLLAKPNAPAGTTEKLVVAALDALRNEGCKFATFGVVPSQTLGDIQGFGFFKKWLATAAFKAARYFFSLDGRRDYWEKFMPDYEPSFVLFNRSSVGLGELVAILRAFNVSIY